MTLSTEFDPELKVAVMNPNSKNLKKKDISNVKEFARKQKNVKVRVFLPTSLDQLDDIIRKEVVQQRASLQIVFAGDGGVFRVMNQTYTYASEIGQSMPPMAIGARGTGNAEATLVGSEDYLFVLGQLDYQWKLGNKTNLPLKELTLIQMLGQRANGERCGPYYFTFAGSGLDAEVLQRYNDFKQKHGKHWWTEGKPGYLIAAGRTAVSKGKMEYAHVALRVNANQYDRIDTERNGERVEIPITPGEDILKDEKEVYGIILGSTPFYGFGFHAFPYAYRANDCNGGMFHVRVITGPKGAMVGNMIGHLRDWHQVITPWRKGHSLWKGDYFSPYIQEYFLDDFSVECQGDGNGIPAHLAGDDLGNFTSIQYRKAPQRAQLVDFRPPQRWRIRRKKER